MKNTTQIKTVIETLENLRAVADVVCSAASELEGVAEAKAFFSASESGGIEDDHLKATLESGENVCVWADIEFYKTFNQKDESDRYAAEESFAAALGSDFHNDGEGDGSTGHIESYCSDFLGTENPARVSVADGRTPTK